MQYLNPKFTVGPAAKQMAGTCERCVWGRGGHVEGCTDMWEGVSRSARRALSQSPRTKILYDSAWRCAVIKNVGGEKHE